MKQEDVLTRYQELAARRQIILDTARRCSELTLPYLLTRSGSADQQHLPQPWQSVGAKGVNVMASKLLLAVMPPTTSFFKLQINDGEIAKMAQEDPKMAEVKSEVDLALSKAERIINQHIADTQDRAVLFGAFKHLVAAGNILVFMPDKEDIKTFPLNRYVVDRDGGQKAIEIITVEVVNRKTLPKEFHTKGELESGIGSGSVVDVPKGEDEVEVFTWAKLDHNDKMWRWHQEVEGRRIPNTDGQAKEDVTPWLPLRFNRVDGEDYGRGRIEEYLGDLRSLDSLTRSLVESSAGAARTVYLVSPSCTSSPEELAKAGNLAFLVGREGDVVTVKTDKGQDLGVAKQMIDELTARLSEAFLVFTPRQSERTTAEEIRATQQELNEQLGGNLGNITVDLLQPYLARKMHLLKKKQMLPEMPKDLVFPTIVTGMDGIGRGQDREALIIFAETLNATVGPEVMAQFIKVPELISRLAASVGIDSLGLIKTEEELDQEKQGAQQQQIEEQQVANQPGMAKAEVEAMKLQQEQANAQGNTQGPPAGGN